MNQISTEVNGLAQGILPLAIPTTRSKLELQAAVIGDAAVLHCQGRITYRDEAAMLSATAIELMQDNCRLVLDLSGVDRIDTAGLGGLVSILNWSRILGCSLKLAGPSRFVQQLLELTRLTTVLSIYPSLESALADFQEHAA